MNKAILILPLPLLLGCANSGAAISQNESKEAGSGEILISSSPISSQQDQKSATKENEVDVFVFMGQSNMAGRGDKEKSVVCEKGHGYEFRAISDPAKLYGIEEP